MKILTIFCAIVSTINPQYNYIDANGVKKEFYLKDYKEYKNIPADTKPEISQAINPFNHHSTRLSILKLNMFEDDDKVTLGLGEKICSPSSRKLNDHIGIKELDSLYNDVFDTETSEWNKRSNVMQNKYDEDLSKLYTVFTGNEVRPDTVKSFYDIEMMDFSITSNCANDTFTKSMHVNKNDVLIKKYLLLVKQIEDISLTQKNKLNQLLKKLFKKNGDNFIINPTLTIESLIKIESRTKKIILNLYIKCEDIFVRALLVYEQIYLDKIKELQSFATTSITGQAPVSNPIVDNTTSMPPIATNSSMLTSDPIPTTNHLTPISDPIPTNSLTPISNPIPSATNTNTNPINPINPLTPISDPMSTNPINPLTPISDPMSTNPINPLTPISDPMSTTTNPLTPMSTTTNPIPTNPITNPEPVPIPVPSKSIMDTVSTMMPSFTPAKPEYTIGQS